MFSVLYPFCSCRPHSELFSACCICSKLGMLEKCDTPTLCYFGNSALRGVARSNNASASQVALALPLSPATPWPAEKYIIKYHSELSPCVNNFFHGLSCPPSARMTWNPIGTPWQDAHLGGIFLISVPLDFVHLVRIFSAVGTHIHRFVQFVSLFSIPVKGHHQHGRSKLLVLQRVLKLQAI